MPFIRHLFSHYCGIAAMNAPRQNAHMGPNLATDPFSVPASVSAYPANHLCANLCCRKRLSTLNKKTLCSTAKIDRRSQKNGNELPQLGLAKTPKWRAARAR